MDEAAIEAKGLAPLKPALDRDRRDRRRGRPRARARRDAARRRRRRSTTRTSTPPTSSASGSRRTSTTRRSYSPFLLQGGLGMPDRDYYLDAVAAHGGDPDEVPGARRRRAEARRDRRRRREGRADRRARDEDRRGAREPRGLRGRPEGQQPLDARGLRRPSAPGLDWTAFFAAAGLGGQPTFVVWQPGAVTGIAALVRERAARRRGRTTSPSAPSSAPRRSCRRRSSTSSSRSTARCSRARRSCATAGSAPSTSTDAALGEAVGKLYVARYFPPSEKARAEEMVKNEIAAFARRIDASTGWRRRRRRKAKAKLAVAEGRRRLSGQVARLLGPRGRRAATRSATPSAPRSSSTGATSRSSASRSTAASG